MGDIKKGRVSVKRQVSVVIISLAIWLMLGSVVNCCVGRLLVVAVDGSKDQVIMGEMLSALINERTGTTVNIVETGGLEKCHGAVLNGEADIYINYIGSGVAGTEGSYKVNDPQKGYTLVSQSYLENFGMVWLKPFGFEGPVGLEGDPEKGGGSLAAPVTTKDVLRKFPVLDRLINKLGGKIDDEIMARLDKETEGREVKEVVREFLKSNRLI